MQTARLELQNNGRANAFKMMVVMTDGVANLPGLDDERQEPGDPGSQRRRVGPYPGRHDQHGSAGHTAPMSQVASITNGVYFCDIPGGQTAAQYSTQLQAVWKQIADNRPLKLVQ